MMVAIRSKLPSEQDPAVQDLFSKHSALISEEKSQRSDHEFRQSLSPTAIRACSIADKIRKHEHVTIWSTRESPGQHSSDEALFPGMKFTSANAHMRKTKLWRIVQNMPKGSLLHCHLGAMVQLDWVVKTAIDTKGMVISSNRPLFSKEVRGSDEAVVSIVYSNRANKDATSIWTQEYEPGTQIPLAQAAASYPDGGMEGLVTWLVYKYSINQEDSLHFHLGVDDIWKKFKFGFAFNNTIVFYEPILRKFLREFFRTMTKDKIRWVEMRGMNRSFTLEGQESTPGVDNSIGLLRVLQEELDTFKKSSEGKDFGGVRLIWDALRLWGTEPLIEDMEFCMKAKAAFPSLVSGFDLVGPEDDGRTLHSLAPELLWFQSQCRARGLIIPFFLHAGETTSSGGETDQNLYTALLLKSRRLGHGFSLYKHPLLIDKVKADRVLIECCPISNEVLRYTASVMTHPMPALLARGVKCALSNDDPGLMGHGDAGLTADFWQCLQGWEDLGLAGLGSMALDGVRWSCFEDMSDEEWQKDVETGEEGSGLKAKMMAQWRHEWEEFCKWVVEEYGN